MSKNNRVGGRPKLDQTLKRNKSIELSLNTNEYELILQKLNISRNDNLSNGKKRKNVAPAIRQYLLYSEHSKANNNEKVNSNVVFEINKIGVNINQISKVVNQKNKVHNSLFISKELQKLNNQLEKLTSILDKII